MHYRGRFAPSPTGELHAGSLVAALGSWLCARRAGGRWLVRVDDLDPPREVPGSARSILEALREHGLDADEPVLYQSQRETAYQAAFDRLRADGHVFACWCSRNDLAPHGGLHRDGRCITPPLDDRPPAWRLRVPDRTMRFEDRLQGPCRQALREEVGDVVIRRADDCWSYHLACVVDDAFQGVTEVVRGCDLLDSTPRQILLQELLDLPTPSYLHLPLALRADGGKLSKSTRDLPLDRADPLPALRQALRFLGIERPRGDSVSALLHHAVDDFDPQRIPRRYSAPWPTAYGVA
ncbi:tRNA glutamyl-Q(34) synthetase GluQRS [Oleiagrimonas soli]|uniref:Glutamyl-Q tRNA(Asp) synthetase n=1 Tax=Oleiagrimonas soli TaxID=1543381 RepID=A0A099CUV8_9GAMM|nr:tRNA glutamyl-Q(34) synthetase GluQRS [Oleiagrimonas soli]KGI77539.1 glutamyl-Q tRNA(Asp) ligase [Oleiagrimonas soli]MBB6182989.1 glutamyl-Q tRNA(Asp) synthetase [Oleiagrimonas soli]